MIAVLALLATSLTFPWAASAQETSTSPATSASATPTSTASPSGESGATAANETTSGGTTTNETTSGATTAPTQQRTTSSARPTPSSVPAESTVRQTPQAAPRKVQPFALNPGIDVSIDELEGDPATGPDGSLLVGDSVQISGEWTAPDEAVGGDQFSIDFPEELEIEAENFALNGTGDTIWGNCEINAGTNRVTCTLTDVVNDLSDVGGTFFMYSTAVERVTTETIDFEVNGQTQSVPLPGEGGIGDGVVIGNATKSGTFTPDKQAITWTIDIPGSELAALADADGVVTLEDNLSANMELCEDRANTSLRAGRGNDTDEIPGGVSVTQGEPGTPISIVIDTGENFNEEFLYQVRYTTCTTSGVVDPAGTSYTNSVDIGGTVVGGEGIGQGWKPETAPRKSGSWVGDSRYSALDWDIFIPGTTFTNESVNISENLSANHTVCADGLGLTVTMRDHLPLPGSSFQKSVDVTEQFTITGDPGEGATSFNLDLTWKGEGAFDPEKYYIVEFQTCVTGDEVPNSDVSFTNTATISGEGDTEVSATVNGHNFPSNKRGTFNTEPKTVNGVEQPANTTVDWQIDVAGHSLESLNEAADAAVISDTFSGTLAVCEADGTLKENLNLSVTSRDFQNGKEVETRDLTDVTAVALNGNTLEFTLPIDDGGYHREVTYDIDYTLCTSSGGVDSRGTDYGNQATWKDQQFTRWVERSSGAGGTGQGVARGSFSLEKSVAQFSESFPIDDTVFTVQVEEFAPEVDPATGDADETYTVEIKADGTPVSGFNARGAGWQIRLTEINLPQVDGVYFEPGVFLAGEGVELNDDASEALIAIEPQTNVEVELVNNAVLGTANVTKSVVGSDEALAELTGNEKFIIHADVDTGVEGSERHTITLADGQSFDLGDLPIGTTVTFSEEQPANTDRITWAEPVIEPESLVIGADPAANDVSVTNEASITQGTFEIAKELTGPEAFSDAVPETFEVLATWNDAAGVAQQKSLTLPADGTSVPFGEELPGGTEVTLTETVPANGSGLAWSVPSFSGDVRIDDDGSAVVTVGQEPAAVTVTNFVDTNDGTLRLTKQVSGEAAEAAEGAEVTVEARWQEGTEFVTEELTLTPGESTPLGVDLPVGTQVTFSEVGFPEIPGAEWSDISWGTDPSERAWLGTNRDGTATGIISDDPTEGRLITLTNEAQWSFGSVGFEKFLFDGEDPVPATEFDLPEGAEFEVQIDGIDPALPADVDFPAVGETITLNAANDWSWESGDVLPRDTVITFSEVDPEPLDGISWARPFYYVASDAGEPGDRDTVEIVPGEHAEVEIRNRPIPTTEVNIDKIVTGPKGSQVADHESTTFQVTATWTDADHEERTCILDVTPDGGMTPTAECDAAVVGGNVQFPVDTEITFNETGAHTEVGNVNWGDVNWSVAGGNAETGELEGVPTGAVVTPTGDEAVTLELENETSSRGLIFLPIPIPLPPFGSGSTIPPVPGLPTVPGPERPFDPSGPQRPGRPTEPGQPTVPAQPAPQQPSGQQKPTGHNGAPGKPAPAKPSKTGKSGESALAVTGANVAWLGGAALVLIAGGTWLMLRNRRDPAAE